MPNSEHPHTDSVAIARLQEQVRGLYTRFDKQDRHLETLVSRTEFSPIQKIAYGLVGIVMTAVLAALMTTLMGAR
jgi:hypothetical protein